MSFELREHARNARKSLTHLALVHPEFLPVAARLYELESKERTIKDNKIENQPNKASLCIFDKSKEIVQSEDVVEDVVEDVIEDVIEDVVVQEKQIFNTQEPALPQQLTNEDCRMPVQCANNEKDNFEEDQKKKETSALEAIEDEEEKHEKNKETTIDEETKIPKSQQTTHSGRKRKPVHRMGMVPQEEQERLFEKAAKKTKGEQEPPQIDPALVCPMCGYVAKTKNGRAPHMRFCKGKYSNESNSMSNDAKNNQKAQEEKETGFSDSDFEDKGEEEEEVLMEGPVVVHNNDEEETIDGDEKRLQSEDEEEFKSRFFKEIANEISEEESGDSKEQNPIQEVEKKEEEVEVDFVVIDKDGNCTTVKSSDK